MESTVQRFSGASGVSKPLTAARHLKRFQLQWKPSMTFLDNGETPSPRVVVFGEKLKYRGVTDDYASAQQTRPEESYDYTTFDLPTIVRMGYNTMFILPFNTSVALAQEYEPKIKNKLVQYNTLGGNTVSTFGQGIKTIDLRITIIKRGRHWESYEKGLQAMAYWSGDQGRYFGSLMLTGYDSFDDNPLRKITSRYKVVVDSLDFSHRSDRNTQVNATMKLVVTHDYSQQFSDKVAPWGAL